MKIAGVTFASCLCLAVPVALLAQTQAPLLSELERDLAALVDEAKPCVVSVAAKVVTYYGDRRERRLLGLWGQKRSRRTLMLHNVGSGLVVDDSGHVVTRTSVVADADEIVVRLYDGRMVPASFVGADHGVGLAVIRIPAVPRAARLGSTQSLRSGSWVTVIGSSLGMAPSVSFGLVDGLRDDGLMQLSASVAAGSAGSPVFNTRGEVVGLVAAAVGARAAGRTLLAAGDAPSYVLAYPIEQVRSVVQRIIELESVGDGWLGITVMSRDSSDRPMVTAIVEGGPAHQAGVREGDILLRFAGKELAGSDDAARAVRATAPGCTTTLEVERDGQPLSLRVTVGQRPAAPKVAVRGSLGPGWSMPEQHLAPTTIGPTDQRTLEETVRRLQRRLGELEKEIRSLRRSSSRE